MQSNPLWSLRSVRASRAYHRAYAVAKIAGIEMCRDIIAATRPISRSHANKLYGAGDNYDPQNSHVIPAIIRKLHEAKIKGQKTSVIWGTGTRLGNSSIVTTWLMHVCF